MRIGFYMRDPDLWDYYVNLSSPVQNAILRNNICTSSLGELQTMADHLKADMGLS